MKKSSFFALALAALAASGVSAQVVDDTGPRLTISRTYDDVTTMTAIRYMEPITVGSLRGGNVLQIADVEAAKALPLVELLRAGQYELHQLARNRPEVTPSWIEAPSV